MKRLRLKGGGAVVLSQERESTLAASMAVAGELDDYDCELCEEEDCSDCGEFETDLVGLEG